MKPFRFVVFLSASILIMVGAVGRAQTAPGVSAQSAPRVVLPIHQTTLSDGSVRYSVPVRIDGAAPIDAMLDTGSKGLRMLAVAVSHPHDGPPAFYFYGSGVKISGKLVALSLAFGDMQGSAKAQLITDVGCTEKKPHCPASRVDSARYRLGGDGVAGQGFEAILGISPTALGRQADNPLSALGVSAWIVELPRPGDTAPGRLILNPSADEQRAYTHFPSNPHGQIDGCLTNRTSNEQICKPILLDSGAVGVAAALPDVAQPQPWPAGTLGTLSFSTGTASASLTLHFDAQAAHMPGHVALVPQGDSPFAHISAGVLPYFSYSVLYNRSEPWIGLAKRSD